MFGRLKETLKSLDFGEMSEDHAHSASYDEVEIRLTEVEFSLGQKQILKRINLQIKENEHVLLRGDNGLGKSTLLKIIAGVLEPTGGTVKLHSELRQGAIYIPQKIELFNRSIYDNLVYPQQRADIEEIHRWIQALGLNTLITCKEDLFKPVGEFGSKISGGEKQKILLARAFLQHPKLLLLDECTTHLDQNTLLRVHEILQQECSDITIIYISHSENCEQYFDRIIRIQDIDAKE